MKSEVIVFRVSDPKNATYGRRVHVAAKFDDSEFSQEEHHMVKHNRNIFWQDDMVFSEFDPHAITCKTCRKEYDLDKAQKGREG